MVGGTAGFVMPGCAAVAVATAAVVSGAAPTEKTLQNLKPWMFQNRNRHATITKICIQ